MDVDSRLLRSFVAVAEEGNLTRAAERLFLSQPALTKQIKQLEQLLGAELFVRSRSGMALTGPGRALAVRAPDVLAAVDSAVRETRSAERAAARVLRVGFLASAANEATQEIVADFSRRRPGLRVELRQAAWSNPTAGLADGEVDAALLRLPFPGQDRYRVEVLLTEDRVAVLPVTHRLAGRERLEFRELWDEPFVAAPPTTGPWCDYWLAVDAREGHPVRIGAVTDQPDEWLNAIANGYGIALAPASAARFYARPGVVYVPVDGISPTSVGVARSPADDENPVVADFVRSCLRVAADPDEPGGTVSGGAASGATASGGGPSGGGRPGGQGP
ncbi:LysR family transcriptional regulator [Streptomyces boluensis]|uniref:LysR family transcriptional regulator n=1 Tax=Streptomyces boluensis TaxID=1775135 RepID=A0A964XN78_9ACTN|nr:LysR family transcriptional regulator [Streptomyces boluensis]NBE55195.1 LysR family transcriptional regulator [Streptomyces boluensis]